MVSRIIRRSSATVPGASGKLAVRSLAAPLAGAGLPLQQHRAAARLPVDVWPSVTAAWLQQGLHPAVDGVQHVLRTSSGMRLEQLVI